VAGTTKTFMSTENEMFTLDFVMVLLVLVLSVKCKSSGVELQMTCHCCSNHCKCNLQYSVNGCGACESTVRAYHRKK